MTSHQQGLAHSKCSIKLAAAGMVTMVLAPTDVRVAAEKGRSPGPDSPFLSFSREHTSLGLCLPPQRSSPTKTCSPHPPTPWPPASVSPPLPSTMAVIINGLSQCHSCGPLKTGLNNKILAYGNFFSSPAPSFSLPHSSLVTHANVHHPPFPSFSNTFPLQMARGQTGFCLPSPSAFP